MPTCPEGYRSKRVDDLVRLHFGNASVVTIAQSLKEQLCGSADGMSYETMDEAAEIIKFYLAYWVDAHRKTISDQYDSAVQLLLAYVHAWYLQDKARRIASKRPSVPQDAR